jgi:hypothetical protein
MNFNRLLFKTSALAASVLVFATASARLGAQVDESHSDTHLQDLKAMRNMLMNDVNDFAYLRKSLHGAEANAAFQIANEAEKAYLGIDAIFYLLAIDSRMQCDQDRAVAKEIIKNSLEENSQHLENEIGKMSGPLRVITLPAAKRMSTQIRDELLVAKKKLDQIAASLD